MPPVFDFELEGLLTRDQAIQLVGPLKQPLANCWQFAWRDWDALPEEFRARVSASPIARANVLNALAVSYAKELLPAGVGIEPCDDLHFFKIYVTQGPLAAVLRFNGLGRDGAVHNINSSDQKHDYFCNLPIAGLRNDVTRLTVGYSVDPSKSRIQDITISLQIGEDLIYDIPIDDEHIEQLPVPEPAPPSAPTATRVTMKGQRKAKEG